MDKHYKNIRRLIENNLVEVKKNEISSNHHTLMSGNFSLKHKAEKQELSTAIT